MGHNSDLKTPWWTPPGIARILLALTSVYILFCSTAVVIATDHATRFYTVYFFAILLLTVTLSLYSLKTLKFRELPKSKDLSNLVFALGASLVIWWVYRKPILLEFSVWYDEVTQYVGWDPKIDFVRFAAQQQQPPIDYGLSHFMRIYFGLHEWAVVFHAAIFSGISLLMLALWTTQVQLSRLLAILPLIFFATQHALLQASSEGRPISLGVYFAVLWMILAYENDSKSPSKYPLDLLACSLLLLYSLGMQPAFFLALMALLWVPRYIIISAVVPFVLFAPTLYEIYRESVIAQQFHPDPISLSFLERLSQIPPDVGYQFENSFSSMFLVLLVPPVLLIFSERDKDRRLGWSTLGYAFIFPLTFLITWVAWINWYLASRYFVLWPVGFLCLSCLCLARAIPIIKVKIRTLAAVTLTLLIFVQLHYFFKDEQRTHILGARDYILEWRRLLAKVPANQNAVFIEVPYLSKSEWTYQHLAGPIFETPYHRIPNLSARLNTPPYSQYQIISARLDSIVGTTDIYYIFKRSQSISEQIFRDLQKHLIGPNRHLFYDQTRYFVIHSKLNQRSLSQETIHFYKHVLRFDPSSELNSAIRYSLSFEEASP